MTAKLDIEMKKKILVIEKDEYVLDVVTLILEEEGYHVFTSLTENGMIDKIRLLKPDAILLDIVRPSIEGTELCRLIKKTEDIKDIPLIILSTHPQAMAVKELCADEVVPKPFDIGLLGRVIHKQLAS